MRLIWYDLRFGIVLLSFCLAGPTGSQSTRVYHGPIVLANEPLDPNRAALELPAAAAHRELHSGCWLPFLVLRMLGMVICPAFPGDADGSERATVADLIAAISIPLRRSLGWISNSRYKAPWPLAWFEAHLARAWVSANPMHSLYVEAWAKAHPDVVAQVRRENPRTRRPAVNELAVAFFEHFSKNHSGMFPRSVAHYGPGLTPQAKIAPLTDLSDMQSMFFDLWRRERSDAGQWYSPAPDLRPWVRSVNHAAVTKGRAEWANVTGAAKRSA